MSGPAFAPSESADLVQFFAVRSERKPEITECRVLLLMPRAAQTKNHISRPRMPLCLKRGILPATNVEVE